MAKNQTKKQRKISSLKTPKKVNPRAKAKVKTLAAAGRPRYPGPLWDAELGVHKSKKAKRTPGGSVKRPRPVSESPKKKPEPPGVLLARRIIERDRNTRLDISDQLRSAGVIGEGVTVEIMFPDIELRPNVTINIGISKKFPSPGHIKVYF